MNGVKARKKVRPSLSSSLARGRKPCGQRTAQAGSQHQPAVDVRAWHAPPPSRARCLPCSALPPAGEMPSSRTSSPSEFRAIDCRSCGGIVSSSGSARKRGGGRGADRCCDCCDCCEAPPGPSRPRRRSSFSNWLSTAGRGGEGVAAVSGRRLGVAGSTQGWAGGGRRRRRGKWLQSRAGVPDRCERSACSWGCGCKRLTRVGGCRQQQQGSLSRSVPSLPSSARTTSCCQRTAACRGPWGLRRALNPPGQLPSCGCLVAASIAVARITDEANCSDRRGDRECG